MNTRRTRVVVVEDSPTQRAFLRKSLEADGDIQVVAEAATAASALAAVARGEPDLVTVDLNIPGGGQSVIEKIMQTAPRPILVLSGSVGARSPDTTRALGAGAAAVMVKPLRWEESDERELRRRVRALQGMRMWSGAHRDVVDIAKANTRMSNASAAAPAPPRTPMGQLGAAAAAARLESMERAQSVAAAAAGVRGRDDYRARAPKQVIGLAASTGGPKALAEVLRGMQGLDLPVMVVQHIGAQSVRGLADWLTRTTGWPVDIAADGDFIAPGRVVICPNGRHLTLGDGGRVVLVDQPVTAHMPSADVLFHSLARTMGSRTVAAILTGMGNDGAAGILAVRQAGGVTIAQDEATSVVFGMAKAAIDLGGIRHTVPIEAVATIIVRMTKGL